MPWDVTTRHPHHTLVGAPGTGFMQCSQCWRWTVRRESSQFALGGSSVAPVAVYFAVMLLPLPAILQTVSMLALL